MYLVVDFFFEKIISVKFCYKRYFYKWLFWLENVIMGYFCVCFSYLEFGYFYGQVYFQKRLINIKEYIFYWMFWLGVKLIQIIRQVYLWLQDFDLDSIN